jgi:spore coat polysaccharide biosynthesis predicted glycosyltransferase SpsG
VIGPCAKLADRAASLEAENVSILKDPASMAGVMSQCDIAVAGAGSMFYELAALGVPSLLVSQAGNQLAAAGFLSREGLARHLGHWDEVSEKLLRGEAEALLSDCGRRSIESERLKSAVCRNGAMNTATAIMGALG